MDFSQVPFGQESQEVDGLHRHVTPSISELHKHLRAYTHPHLQLEEIFPAPSVG